MPEAGATGVAEGVSAEHGASLVGGRSSWSGRCGSRVLEGLPAMLRRRCQQRSEEGWRSGVAAHADAADHEVIHVHKAASGRAELGGAAVLRAAASAAAAAPRGRLAG